MVERDGTGMDVKGSGADDRSARRVRSRATVAVSDEADLLRKPVNTLAIVPKSSRITALGRKSYNVLLYRAQDQGLDNHVFRAPLEQIIRGLDFDSNDHGLIKKHLRAMVSTTVEWQSPTSGEGSSWNVSGLLAHARLSKERGQVWVEWSYAINLKQELLQPTVFARLRLEIISQLRSHAGVALYEICTRYKDVGRTARQAWRWWQPVLTGNPPSEKMARQEYRIFKRDTLKTAVAEINAITDIEIELIEHKQGRLVDEIQFSIQDKRPGVASVVEPPPAVDMGLIARAQRLGIAHDAAEALVQAHGEEALRVGLDALERRLASSFPESLREPLRYLRALMPAEASKVHKQTEDQAEAEQARSDPRSPAGKALSAKRQAHWLAEWMRRRRERCIAELQALSGERQSELSQALLAELQDRNAHPSVIKRLQASGWQHPMVIQEMLRFYALGAYGEDWDKPSAEELLRIAVELGEEPAPRR
jgi:hypothetical protein